MNTYKAPVSAQEGFSEVDSVEWFLTDEKKLRRRVVKAKWCEGQEDFKEMCRVWRSCSI